MSRWNRLRQMPAADRRLLAKSAFLLICIRIGLAWFRYSRIVSAVERIARRSNRLSVPCSERQIIWAIGAASRHLPLHATCLVRALAGLALFRQAGIPVELHIGVQRSPAGIRAHAWLERDSKVVLGNQDDLGDYARLTSLSADADNTEPCSA